MKKLALSCLVIFLPLAAACSDGGAVKGPPAGSLYTDEAHAVIGRGLVSYPRDNGHVALSWRLLPDDPQGIVFGVYRKEIGANDNGYVRIGRTDRTSYVDREASGGRHVYAIRPLTEGSPGTPFSRESIALSPVGGRAALVFDLKQHYEQARVATGDLDGDGEPEVVVAYSGYRNVDPYEKARTKSQDTVKVAAFRPTGERLWVLDLGWGIEAGLNYQPMVVADVDGDGRAEVILKTNRSSNPLDHEGERLTILDGMTGRVKQEAEWPSLDGLGSDYNNDSRNYLAVAHLNGRDSYIIAVRGLYLVQRMWAYDKDLRKVWGRTLGLDHFQPEGLSGRLIKFWNIDDKWKYLRDRLGHTLVLDQYRGSHSLPIADINEDGKEEILWGERCIGENGTDLWTIRERFPYLGHPDVVIPAKIVPSLQGQQVFIGREGWSEKPEKIGVYLVDSQGKVLWARWGYHHIDRGWVGAIDAAAPGTRCLGIDIREKQWSKEGAKLIEPTGYLWDPAGQMVGNPPPSWYFSFPVDWDGDGVRDICIMEEGFLRKYGTRVQEKVLSNCLFGADLFGDHREEIVAAPGDGKIYILFNTDDMKAAPRVTPLADRQYRNDLTRTAMHGYVIPMEGGVLLRKARK
jgi:rhamnogalacturonan endolyase